MRKTGRDMLLWPGVCIVHEAFSETELVKLKAQHPGAPVAAHPECPAHILDHADYVGSTSGILAYAKALRGDTLIVATEPHIIHQMELAIPDKTFIGAPGADGNCNCNICPYMALNTMEKLYLALRRPDPAYRHRGRPPPARQEEPRRHARDGERDGWGRVIWAQCR